MGLDLVCMWLGSRYCLVIEYFNNIYLGGRIFLDDSRVDFYFFNSLLFNFILNIDV